LALAIINFRIKMRTCILLFTVLCSIYQIQATLDVELGIEIDIDDDHCNCTKTELPQGLDADVKTEFICSTETGKASCFELVFLVDGRDAAGTNGLSSEQVFDIVKEWIFRVVHKVQKVTSGSKSDFLVIIQYADKSILSLATELDTSFEILRQQINGIQAMNAGNVTNSDNPIQLTKAMQNVVDIYNGKATIEGSEESNNKWKESRDKHECKRILFTFTHGYVVSQPSDSLMTEINTIFDRTDVVTVVYRDQNSLPNNAYNSAKLLQSPNGITYEYETYVKLLNGVDEIQRHICDPMPANYEAVCDVELVFLIDSTYCTCNADADMLYKNIRHYVNEVADSYRSDKRLLLGKGFGLGLHAYFPGQDDVEFESLFDVNFYRNKDSQTTSLDEFRAAVSKFDISKQPFSDVATNAENVGAIPLHKVLKKAETFFSTNNEDAENGPTRILVILKNEPVNSPSLGDNLLTQSIALQQQFEHNINLIALPIRDIPTNLADNSDIYMLNAVLDNPTPSTELTVLTREGRYSHVLVASFETALGHIPTCADSTINYDPSQYTQVNGTIDQYSCECHMRISLNASACYVGYRGSKGPDGHAGDKGPIGNTGLDGSDGPDGGVGPQGPPGQPGLEGISGLDGPKGPEGATGPIGRMGNSGVRGAPGNDAPETRYYEWDQITKLVEKSCNCSKSCVDPKPESDWVLGHSDKSDLDDIFRDLKKNDEDFDAAKFEESIAKYYTENDA